MATFNGFADDGTPSPAAQIALDGKVDADDDRLSDYRHPLGHEHDPEEIRGLVDRLAALEAEVAERGPAPSEWIPVPLVDGVTVPEGFSLDYRIVGDSVEIEGRVEREDLFNSGSSMVMVSEEVPPSLNELADGPVYGESFAKFPTGRVQVSQGGRLTVGAPTDTASRTARIPRFSYRHDGSV